jgi:hypothetical protein
MWWKISIVVLVLSGLGLFLALSMAGMFEKPEFTEREMGPYTLVYKKIEGEYQQAMVFIRVMTPWLKKRGVESDKSFAWFFDNPQKVEYSDLRFITGYILEDVDQEKMDLVKERYLIKTFPRQRCLVGIFSQRSGLSPLFGLMKVYPELEARSIEKGYTQQPIIELYDKTEKQIVYLQPVDPGVDVFEEYFASEEDKALGTKPKPVPTEYNPLAEPESTAAPNEEYDPFAEPEPTAAPNEEYDPFADPILTPRQ